MDMNKRSAESTQATKEEQFTENLKYYLKQKGISQKQLAEISGVGKSTISTYMNGTFPTLNAIIQIADALGVTVDALLGYPSIPRAQKNTYGDLARMIVALLESKQVELKMEEGGDIVLDIPDSPLFQFVAEYQLFDAAIANSEDIMHKKMLASWLDGALYKLDNSEIQSTSNE